MTEIRIEGYVFEVGSVWPRNVARSTQGIVIETVHGDMTVVGLSKPQCRELAQRLREPVTLVITVGKPDGTI